jgi:hypothetical protein
VPLARRRLSLLDIISTGTMDGNSLPYVQEGGTYAAAETTEGAVKPEAGITLTDAQADAATIANWKKIQKQSARGLRGAAHDRRLASALRVLRRLEGQILVGNGTTPNLRGIRNTSGIQTQAFAAARSRRCSCRPSPRCSSPRARPTRSSSTPPTGPRR